MCFAACAHEKQTLQKLLLHQQESSFIYMSKSLSNSNTQIPLTTNLWLFEHLQPKCQPLSSHQFHSQLLSCFNCWSEMLWTIEPSARLKSKTSLPCECLGVHHDRNKWNFNHLQHGMLIGYVASFTIDISSRVGKKRSVSQLIHAQPRRHNKKTSAACRYWTMHHQIYNNINISSSNVYSTLKSFKQDPQPEKGTLRVTISLCHVTHISLS